MGTSSQSDARPRCQPKHSAGGRSLPVVAPRSGGEIEPGRIGRWRAAVLVGVHVLIALHVAHWLTSGRTLSPLEPSEAMEFSKHGIVNAGLIFFALAIASTLIFGRWVCGWACHLVALQDLARWMLKKAGIRPKALRSRLLGLVPLLAFLYMFIGPLAYVWLEGAPFAVRGFALTREHFWETFPSWVPAILTFVVCGFVVIYFLGQKGFCTNACPYGGIFGVADQFAAMRIRVTDACDQCGHCTAVCTSNVRVHEEVREFKAVIDPGCMKCLDCVHVCPNEALYVGWGAPALLARGAGRAQALDPSRARKDADGTSRGRGATASLRPRLGPHLSAANIPEWHVIAGWLVTAAFAYLSLLLFSMFDHAFGWGPAGGAGWMTQTEWLRSDAVVAGILAACAVGIALVFSPKRARPAPFDFFSESVLGGAFVAALLAFRGLYGMVAFLFALGLAALIAYLVLKLVRLPMEPTSTLHNLRLKVSGRLQPAGYGFLLAMGALLGLWAHSAVIQYHAHAFGRLDGALAPLLRQGDPLRVHERLTAAQSAAVAAALGHAGFLERWSLIGDSSLSLGQARLNLLAGRPQEYEARLIRILAGRPQASDPALELASYYVASGRRQEALDCYERYCAQHPRDERGYAYQGLLLGTMGDFDGARAVLDRGIARLPGSALLLMNRGLVEAEAGQLRAALPWLEKAVAADPALAQARQALEQLRAALSRGGG